jgi:hypothetical protein
MTSRPSTGRAPATTIGMDFGCPYCGPQLKAPEGLAGKTGRCVHRGQRVALLDAPLATMLDSTSPEAAVPDEAEQPADGATEGRSESRPPAARPLKPQTHTAADPRLLSVIARPTGSAQQAANPPAMLRRGLPPGGRCVEKQEAKGGPARKGVPSPLARPQTSSHDTE